MLVSSPSVLSFLWPALTSSDDEAWYPNDAGYSLYKGLDEPAWTSPTDRQSTTV